MPRIFIFCIVLLVAGCTTGGLETPIVETPVIVEVDSTQQKEADLPAKVEMPKEELVEKLPEKEHKHDHPHPHEPIDSSNTVFYPPPLEGDYEDYFYERPEYICDGFDLPVGKPDGQGYYIAQKFMRPRHLGDDFNAVTGGNTDLGHPIYSVANGLVTMSLDLKGGWGRTIRVVHQHKDGKLVESLYTHCDELMVEPGDYVWRGQQIGTIGTAHGQYMAHLHFEIRTKPDAEIGRGYADVAPPHYEAPTPYIWKYRPNEYHSKFN